MAWNPDNQSFTEQLHGIKPCIFFGPLRVCQGDRIAIVLSRGETVVGIFLGYSSGFLALARSCEEARSMTVAEVVGIRRVARVIVLGRCEESGDVRGEAGGVGQEDKD